MKLNHISIIFILFSSLYGSENLSHLFIYDMKSDSEPDSIEIQKADSLLKKASMLHPELILWRLRQIRKEISEEEYHRFYIYYAARRNLWIKKEITAVNKLNYITETKKAVVEKLKERFIFGLTHTEIDSVVIKANQKQTDYIVYKFYKSDQSLRFSQETNYRFLREKKEKEVFTKMLKILNRKAKSTVYPKEKGKYIFDHYYILQKPGNQKKYYPFHKWIAEILNVTIEKELIANIPPFNPLGKRLSVYAGGSFGAGLEVSKYSKLGEVAPEIPVNDTKYMLPQYLAGFDYYHWQKKDFEPFQYISISPYLKYFPEQDYDSRKDINTSYYQLADQNDPESVRLSYTTKITTIHFDPTYIFGFNVETPIYFFTPAISAGIAAGYEAQLIRGKEEIYIRELIRYNSWSFHYDTVGGSYEISEINHVFSASLLFRLNYHRFLGKITLGWPYSAITVGFFI